MSERFHYYSTKVYRSDNYAARFESTESFIPMKPARDFNFQRSDVELGWWKEQAKELAALEELIFDFNILSEE